MVYANVLVAWLLELFQWKQCSYMAETGNFMCKLCKHFYLKFHKRAKILKHITRIFLNFNMKYILPANLHETLSL